MCRGGFGRNNSIRQKENKELNDTKLLPEIKEGNLVLREFGGNTLKKEKERLSGVPFAFGVS